MPTQHETWHDAYDAQMATWRYERSEEGLDWATFHFRNSIRGLHNPGAVEMIANLYRSEPNRLVSGDPIFISAQMCQVIEAAYPSFQPEPLLVSDLITPTGFVYYETPFQVPDRFDRPVNIAAVSWSPLLGMSEADMERLGLGGAGGVTVAGRPSDMLGLLAQRQTEQGHASDGLAITLYETSERAVTPLVLMHITPWYFGMTFDGNEVDEAGELTGAAWWWKLVQATLRLMQQRIAVRHMLTPPRRQRREASRMGWKPESEVLVVRLRREASPQGEPSGESANYSHRFIVGGHWRNQPYAGGVHRLIWISDYVKGPEELPLVIKPGRAFTWDR